MDDIRKEKRETKSAVRVSRVEVAVVVEVIVSSSDNEKNNACVYSSAEKPEIQFSVANSFLYLSS